MTRTIARATAAALATACASAHAPATHGPPILHEVTAGTIDSLPVISPRDGRLVCLAEGASPCPHVTTRATWLRRGRFATWNQREAVEIWTPGQVDPVRLGDLGTADGQYRDPVSVGMTDGGYVVLDEGGPAALFYTERAGYQSSTPAPANTIVRAFGYAGPVAFMQMLRTTPSDSSTILELHAIDSPGDTLGRVLLTAPIPWLHFRNQRPVGAIPLFAELPVFTIAPDSDVVWSPGPTLDVTRQGPDGSVRWQLRSGATGPTLTPVMIAAIRHAVGADTNAAARTTLDSSLANSARTLPAVSAILLAPDGRVLVLGIATPEGQDRAAYLLDATGLPTARMSIPAAWTVLLHGGDSMLVQRAGANADLELRWLTLKKP